MGFAKRLIPAIHGSVGSMAGIGMNGAAAQYGCSEQRISQSSR
jgi:hypothetical protein